MRHNGGFAIKVNFDRLLVYSIPESVENHRTLKRKDNTEAVNEFGPHSMKFHNTIIYVNSALSDKHHSSASPAQFSSLIFTKATEIFHQPQPTKRGFNEMLRPQIEIRKVIINRNCVWMCFSVGFGFSRAISLSFFLLRAAWLFHDNAKPVRKAYCVVRTTRELTR